MTVFHHLGGNRPTLPCAVCRGNATPSRIGICNDCRNALRGAVLDGIVRAEGEDRPARLAAARKMIGTAA